METNPTVAIPAQTFLDSFHASNNIGCLLEQIVGVLELAVENIGSSNEAKAIYGAISLAEAATKDCAFAQFSVNYRELAEKALAQGEMT